VSRLTILIAFVALGILAGKASAACEDWDACVLPENTKVAFLSDPEDVAREVVCRPEFTWDCEWALAVTWCESRWQSGIVGSEYYEPLGRVIYFVGYWQIWVSKAWSEADAAASFYGHNYSNTKEAHLQFVEWQQGRRAQSPWPFCGAVYP
jgi:hypothetical protein